MNESKVSFRLLFSATQVQFYFVDSSMNANHIVFDANSIVAPSTRLRLHLSGVVPKNLEKKSI